MSSVVSTSSAIASSFSCRGTRILAPSGSSSSGRSHTIRPSRSLTGNLPSSVTRRPPHKAREGPYPHRYLAARHTTGGYDAVERGYDQVVWRPDRDRPGCHERPLV